MKELTETSGPVCTQNTKRHPYAQPYMVILETDSWCGHYTKLYL